MHYADSIHQVNNLLQGYNPLIALANAQLDFADDDILYLKGEEQTTQRISIQNLQHQKMPALQSTMLDSANAEFISGSSDIVIQTPIQGMPEKNREGIMAIIGSLMTASEENWKNLCKEFSWLTHYKTDPPNEIFPEDAAINYLFRSLQYRITAEVEPEFAPKVLEIWESETKPYEPRQLYLMARLMLATQALRYNQVPFTAKKLIGYLKYIIETTDSHKDVGEMYFKSYGQFEEYEVILSKTYKYSKIKVYKLIM